MKEILMNLALIGLDNFCNEHNIDYSGSHVEKDAVRGYRYTLYFNEPRKPIVTVWFTKHAVPTYYIHKEV